jgi:hypothetical protein
MRGWQYKWVEVTAEWSLLGGHEGGGDPIQVEGALDEFGRQGWELVSAFDKGVAQGQGGTRVLAVFKRPLP